ncbi:MAG: LamG-like jellyroll fold domain-containing protein [Verrucomicrobiota bacterium]
MISTVLPYTTGTRIAVDSKVEPGTRYGRIIRLEHNGSANGTLIATFESWPHDFRIYKSVDDGLTWTQISAQYLNSSGPWYMKAEPDLFELPHAVGNLPAGTIMLAGNAVGGGRRLEVWYSLDRGVSWLFRGVVQTADAIHKNMWEPHLGLTSAGQLICYYSDERFTATYDQVLSEKVSPDGGLTWGPEQFVCAIPDGVNRPGMAVVCQMGNGKYVMSFEAVDSGTWSQARIKFSDDGINWGSGPADYGTSVRTTSGAYVGACPYIMWSPAGGPNGTLVISGQFLINSPNTDRQLFINTNLGVGDWTMIPAPVQWQGGGNNLVGWSQGMIPTADGQGIIQLASSRITVNGSNDYNEMLVGRQQLILPGQTYALSNQNSGLALDIPGNTNVHNTQLHQWTNIGGPAQRWQFTDLGHNIWTVKNPGNGLAVDNAGWSTTAGTPIIQWDYTASGAQQWKLKPTGKGPWKLINTHSGMAITVSGASINPGAPIVQMPDNAGTEQNWLPLLTGGAQDGYRLTRYKLDGNTLEDTGNGNHGIASATANNYVASRVGTRALLFNGVDANVQLPRAVGGDDYFSIAFWMKTTSAGGTGTNWYNGSGLIDGKLAGVANDFGVSLLNGRIAFGVGSPDTTLQSTATVNDGRWRHVVVTRNSLDGTMSIHIDGIASGSMTGPLGARVAPPSLRLGSSQSGAAGTFYNGALDDVRLYNALLDAATITQLATVQNPNATLVAKYNFEGNSTDSSGSGNNGTASGVTYVAGKNGQAAQFNGTNASILTPVPVSEDFSIAYWIKTTSTGGTGTNWYEGAGVIDADIAGVAADFGTALMNGKAAFGVGTSDGTPVTTILSTSTINDGIWHHIAATRNSASGAMKLYVDGVLQASATGSTGTRSSTALRIGRKQPGGGYLTGTLDDAALYTYELSPRQIAALVTPEPLPSPWTGADVGSPGAPGYASYNATSGIWSVGGGGADIWQAADHFHFVHQTFSGPGTLMARVTAGAISSDGITNANAKAGIMFRDSLASDAPFVSLVHDQGQGLQFLYRDAAAAAAAQQGANVAVNPAAWLRLTRNGNTITAYYATTVGMPAAENWILIGSHTTNLTNSARAGLVACAHDHLELANTTFTDVTVSSPVPPTISSVSNQTIPENTSTPILPVTLGDAFVPANNLVLTATSSATSLVPDANIALGGSGSSRTVTVTPLPNQSGSATITLVVNNNQPTANTASVSFLVTVQTTLAGSWRQLWFGSTAATGSAATTADPDSDGITNFWERAFNLNPTLANSGAAVWPAVSESGGQLVLTYTRSIAATDLTYQVEWSTDLQTWSSVGVTDSLVSSDGTTQQRAGKVPLATGSPLFMHLRVIGTP